MVAWLSHNFAKAPFFIRLLPDFLCPEQPRARLSSALTLGLKSAYRREMHLAFGPSRQVIEVANIFSALRAHHKPTFSVQIAKLSRLIVIVDRTVGQAGTLVR